MKPINRERSLVQCRRLTRVTAPTNWKRVVDDLVAFFSSALMDIVPLSAASVPLVVLEERLDLRDSQVDMFEPGHIRVRLNCSQIHGSHALPSSIMDRER